MDYIAICKDRFVNNKYLNWYLNIIKLAKTRDLCADSYIERHHIIPRSVDPNFSSFSKYNWNLVRLTAREHFICHRLLVKCTSGDDNVSMKKAIKALCSGSKGQRYNRKYVSRIYEFGKGLMVGSYQNRVNKNKGSKRTQETRDKQSKTRIQLINNRPDLKYQLARFNGGKVAWNRGDSNCHGESGKSMMIEKARLRKRDTRHSTPVWINGEVFEFASDAATKHGITHSALIYRLKSSKPRWAGWCYKYGDESPEETNHE